MNAVVSLSPQMFTTDAKTGALKVKGDSNGFMGMLAGMMTNATNLVTQSPEISEGDADDTTSKLMSEIFTMLLNGASTEDIAEKLLGLTADHKLSLIETADEIMTFISQTTMSDKDKVQNVLSMLDRKKENTDIGLIYQVLAMMGVNVQEIKSNSTPINTQTNTPTQTNTQTQVNAPTQVNGTVTISTGSAQGVTESIIPTVVAPVTENTQQADFSKVSQMLTKIVDAVKQSQSLPADVKIVSSNITDEVVDTQIAQASQKALGTGTVNEVKSAKESSEFDDLLAYAQQSKSSQQVTTSQEVAKATNIEIPVQKQITDGIINQLNTGITSDTKELTLMLKPQELGEVAIKLVKSGGEITVSIMAQNPATEKLLSERLPTLVSNLQEINGQVKDVMIVNPNENTSSFLGQFNLSYSDSGAQYQQKQTSNAYSGTSQSIAEEKTQQTKEFVREGQLWQTA